MIQNSSLYTKIYTVLSHHMNLVPVALLHNIFRKELRTLSLNVHRLVLMKSPRDVSQISHLSRQCFPEKKNYLPSIYNHVMKYDGYPYLVINFSPHSIDRGHIKVSTRIFKEEHPMEVFKESNGGSQPYEKMVLIGADLYDHLMESNHPVTNVSQTVNGDSSPNTSTSNSTMNNSASPQSTSRPLASPPSIPYSPGESIRDRRHRAEGASPDRGIRIRIQNKTTSQKRGILSERFTGTPHDVPLKKLKSSTPKKTPPATSGDNSSLGEANDISIIDPRNAPGKSPRILPDRQARRRKTYSTLGV